MVAEHVQPGLALLPTGQAGYPVHTFWPITLNLIATSIRQGTWPDTVARHDPRTGPPNTGHAHRSDSAVEPGRSHRLHRRHPRSRIAGILLINIRYFLSQAGQSEDPVGTDAVIWQLVDDVALGRFHFVFAFLFGTSVYIFLTRLRAKDRSTWVYVRRMVILVIAGLINSSLGGIDVLASYGVLALVLLPLTFLPR